MPVTRGFPKATPDAEAPEVSNLDKKSPYSSQHWKRLSRRVRALSPTCEYCDDALSEHGDHVNGNDQDRRQANIAAVCSECHRIKTQLYESHKRSASVQSLMQLYLSILKAPPSPPMTCLTWSPLKYLSALIDNRRCCNKPFEILDRFSHLMLFTDPIDKLVLSFLDTPSDLTLSPVTESLNIPLQDALTFTNARKNCLGSLKRNA